MLFLINNSNFPSPSQLTNHISLHILPKFLLHQEDSQSIMNQKTIPV